QKEAEQTSIDLRRRLVEAEKLHKELTEAYQTYEQEKENLKKKAQEEANEIVENTKRKADNIIADLRQRQLESENAPAVKEHELINAQKKLPNLKKEEENLKKNKV